ncbi:hypothetical protein EES39_06170 [Streptomyces sp. ADI92-24]|uniref:hypothetical protein n=1 Tax=unclassified Streptomyces TaxID=2593676 RepID=UPI000F555099|nr:MULTISPECIES: hypothetical protein [unclassified Streptomyces]MCX4772282.1 hypothetical protein [Streptomyces sp. NBC_01285]RPK50196.1 hypothetical protein EES39_06170 [Streptomyces sp. ADI92-24]
MHPETHLQLHDLRSVELRRHADDFRLVHSRSDSGPRTPRTDMRTRLGWTMVEMGLRLIPDRSAAPSRAPRTA